MMRRGRPGLVGTVARTAVIAGTAQAVGGRVSHRQQQRYADEAADQAAAQEQADLAQQQMAAMQAQQAQAAMGQAAGGPASGGDMMGQLQQLAQMRDSGILSEEEFTAAKAKLLGG